MGLYFCLISLSIISYFSYLWVVFFFFGCYSIFDKFFWFHLLILLLSFYFRYDIFFSFTRLLSGLKSIHFYASSSCFSPWEILTISSSILIFYSFIASVPSELVYYYYYYYLFVAISLLLMFEAFLDVWCLQLHIHNFLQEWMSEISTLSFLGSSQASSQPCIQKAQISKSISLSSKSLQFPHERRLSVSKLGPRMRSGSRT